MKEKLKVLYFTNPKKGYTKEIESSLKKLGHKVDVVDDTNFDIKELMAKAYVSDMFLFHQGGIHTENEVDYMVSKVRLKQILEGIKCKKVWWFFEKGWLLNDKTLEDIIPLTTHTFLNDGSWVRRHKYPNVTELHMGAPKPIKGTPREELKCEIAFYGEVYGFRKPFIDLLKKTYGRGFKVFNNVNVPDLVASAKMIFTPIQPNDDYYWDGRIYEILAHGGIAIYPKLQGLEEEGFVSGKHYMGYKRPHELEAILTDVIMGKVKPDGQKFVKQFSWENRVRKIIGYTRYE
jgi:hypothetical protein